MNAIKPLFLLAGGDFHHPMSMVPSMARALQESGVDKPRVAYIGVASGDNVIFYNGMKALLRKAGAAEVFLIHLAKAEVDLTSARHMLGTADAIFLSGGEVDDGMRWLVQHKLVDFFKELRNEGKLFLGVSAGSIMMGTRWVHWKNPNNDDTAELFDCLGFVPTIFDTHAENENWKELKLALRLHGPGSLGYGIPKGGLVIVDNQGCIVESDKALLHFVNVKGLVQKK